MRETLSVALACVGCSVGKVKSCSSVAVHQVYVLSQKKLVLWNALLLGIDTVFQFKSLQSSYTAKGNTYSSPHQRSLKNEKENQQRPVGKKKSYIGVKRDSCALPPPPNPLPNTGAAALLKVPLAQLAEQQAPPFPSELLEIIRPEKLFSS